MKKLIVLIFSLALITSCQNEPLDGDFAGVDIPTNPGNPGGETGSSDLTLSSYQFNLDTTTPIFGDFTVDTDFVMNTNNKVATLDINSIFFGASIVGYGTITRDGSGNITTLKSFEGTSQVNQTNIIYNGSNISTIEYDDFEDDTEDYSYSFVTNGNIISRTASQNNITTEYTFNNANQLTKKESFENGIVIQTEVLTYNTAGNCTTVVTTGNFNDNNTTYGFDTFTNPLKASFSDQFLFSILEDDYSSEAGPTIVQFHSTNNWNSITTADGQVTFAMNYNASNRIISRIGTYDLEDDVVINQEELFNYLN